MKETVHYNSINLDASTLCQLKCPSCPTASKKIAHTIGSGFLRFSDFQKLIDNNRKIKKIEISNYGEIFLNPDLLEIMMYAYKKNVVLTADNGVNLNNVKKEVLEGLIKYKFHSMSCSIDGASKEVYEKYRRQGDYDVVIENINIINQYKSKYKSKYPLLRWQFVVFGHNEHELEKARMMAKSMGMEFIPKLSWDSGFSKCSEEVAMKEFNISSRDEYKEKNEKTYNSQVCNQLWDRPQINWDGRVLGCCRNYWGDFGGNVFIDGLVHALNHEKMNYAKGMLLGINVERSDIPCAICETYLVMKKYSKWLIRNENKKQLFIVKYLPLSIKNFIKNLVFSIDNG